MPELEVGLWNLVEQTHCWSGVRLKLQLEGQGQLAEQVAWAVSRGVSNLWFYPLSNSTWLGNS